MNLVPAYGRDYKSKKAVQEALDTGKDFIVADMSSQWDGKPCNAESLQEAGLSEVRIRYSQQRKVGFFKVPARKGA